MYFIILPFDSLGIYLFNIKTCHLHLKCNDYKTNFQTNSYAGGLFQKLRFSNTNYHRLKLIFLF